MRGVVVVGSANVDHLVVVPRLPAEGETITASRYLIAAGGKGLNQAVATARQGVPVSLVACVGDDVAADDLLALLGREGIDTSAVRRVEGETTGVALITVAAAAGGTNTVVVAPQANARMGDADVDAAGRAIADAAVVLAQLEIPVDAVVRALARGRAEGALTVLNTAPAVWPLPDRLLSLVDVLVANETEAVALTGTPGLSGLSGLAVEKVGPLLVAGGCPTVITTLGSRGALVTTAGGVTRVAAFAVRAMDSTAAGDAFCGALAAGLAAGLSLTDAVRRGAAAGALAATVAGAVPSLPTSAAVDDLLAAG